MRRTRPFLDTVTVPSVASSRWTRLSVLLGAIVVIVGIVSDAFLLGLLTAATLVNAGLTFAHYRRDGRMPPIRWRLRSLAEGSRRQRVFVGGASVLVLLYAGLIAENPLFGGLIVVLLWLGTSLWR